MITVAALYRGRLRSLEPEGQRTGIYKDSIESADVTEEGIAGDHQADRRFHGGPEKALHQYAVSSYERILSEYPELEGRAVPGSIGENISSAGLTDATVCIGDLYRIGPVLAQVSQPRSPCWKINHKFGVEKLSLFIEQQRITGWYYRVLENGTMQVGDRIELVERRNEGASIERFLRVTKQHRPDLAELDALIGCEGLNQEWAARLKSRSEYLDGMRRHKAGAALHAGPVYSGDEGPSMSNEDMEDVLTDLQMRLTYQDDEIRNLNLAVDRQRSELGALKAEIDRLKNMIATLAPGQADGPQDEAPPHY